MNAFVQKYQRHKQRKGSPGLANLLEGVNNEFFKVNFKKYFLFKNGCFKVVKLVTK